MFLSMAVLSCRKPFCDSCCPHGHDKRDIIWKVSLLVALVIGVLYLHFSWFVILQCGKMWQQCSVSTGVFAHAGG